MLSPRSINPDRLSIVTVGACSAAAPGLAGVRVILPAAMMVTASDAVSEVTPMPFAAIRLTVAAVIAPPV